MKRTIKRIWKKYESFIKFCAVGLGNTLISLIIYTICVSIGINYLIGSTLGYIAGILNGYLLSSRYVFKEKANKQNGMKFILVYVTSLLCNLFMLSVLVEYFGINKIVAQIIITGISVGYNYTLNKFWTFKKKCVKE